MTTCTAVTVWPDIGPHGVRLTCALPAGHDGDHGCGEIEWLEEPC
jgi:hypothetical protein